MIHATSRGISSLVADGLGFMFQDRGQLFSVEGSPPRSLRARQAPRQSSPASRRETARRGSPRRDGRRRAAGKATQIIVNREDYGLDVHGRRRRARAGTMKARRSRWARMRRAARHRPAPPRSGVPEATRARAREYGWTMGVRRAASAGFKCVEYGPDSNRLVYAAASSAPTAARSPTDPRAWPRRAARSAAPARRPRPRATALVRPNSRAIGLRGRCRIGAGLGLASSVEVDDLGHQRRSNCPASQRAAAAACSGRNRPCRSRRGTSLPPGSRPPAARSRPRSARHEHARATQQDRVITRKRACRIAQHDKIVSIRPSLEKA